VPRPFGGGRLVFSIDSRGIRKYPWKRTCLNPCLTPNKKINSKQTKHMNIKINYETLGNRAANVYNLRLGNASLGMTSILTKAQNFSTSRATITKVKTQPTQWEGIFANHLSDKCIVSRIYKEHLQLNGKRKTTQFKKMS
jgi:hypothetical protein